MDWNGDGNHNWKDDSLFHNVINNDSGGNGSSSGGGSGKGCLTAVIVAIVIYELIKLIAGIIY